jgi:hypothetical protein
MDATEFMLEIDGKKIAARITMMPRTTSISIKENPLLVHSVAERAVFREPNCDAGEDIDKEIYVRS